MISPDGHFQRVENLRVGDKTFDPLAQKLTTIVNIVPWVAGNDASTAPVLIRKGCLNDAQPSEDFFAPQTLEIFLARVPEGQKLPVAKRVLARDLVEEGLASIVEQLSGLQCYLVLTDSSGLMMTNGVLAVAKAAPQSQSA